MRISEIKPRNGKDCLPAKIFALCCTHELETWMANTKDTKSKGGIQKWTIYHTVSLEIDIIGVKKTNNSYDAESTLWMSWARTTSSKSSSRSMRVRHEQGVSPFPLSQCWNMARQQASGLVGYSALISASFEPLLSKSSWSPNFCQNGATLSMILILSPCAVRSRDSFARLGVAPNKYNKIMHAWGWILGYSDYLVVKNQPSAGESPVIEVGGSCLEAAPWEAVREKKSARKLL